MNDKRPLILISNDDGYEAKGIKELVDMVRDKGDIIVCAPAGARSGQSRAFSTNVLTLDKVSEEPGLRVYKCSGTPVDCIKMAYHQLCPHKPDLVLGGINHGSNASTNAQYSGTVGIAIEAAMKGIPAVAFSLCSFDADADFSPMRDIIRRITSKVLEEGLPRYACLNVNYPLTDHCNGIRYCRMARGHWRKEVVKCQHPGTGGDYYWMTGFYQCDESAADDTDDWALAHDYIAVTPLTVDLTDYALLDKLTQQ